MNQRGFILALAMFAIVALTVVGIASVFISSGEAEVAGNLRRERQLLRCAQAGSRLVAAKWPDSAGTVFATAGNPTVAFNYFINTSLVARTGHYAGTTFGPPVSVMAGDAASGVFSPGNNVANRYGSSGVSSYRIVETCDGPNGSQAEESMGIMFRTGR